jgi:N-terminal half of MaoC dehydratase
MNPLTNFSAGLTLLAPEENHMTTEEESLVTDEMRASVGREGSPVQYEVEKLGVRQFARAVGHKDPVFFDEQHARDRGHRSILAPPGYLGSPVYRAGVPERGPGDADPAAGGRRWRALNGGSEFQYTGVDICAGDVLTAVSKVVDVRQTRGSLGPMIITRRESIYTNQDGAVVCRATGTGIQY